MAAGKIFTWGTKAAAKRGLVKLLQQVITEVVTSLAKEGAGAALKSKIEAKFKETVEKRIDDYAGYRNTGLSFCAVSAEVLPAIAGYPELTPEQMMECMLVGTDLVNNAVIYQHAQHMKNQSWVGTAWDAVAAIAGAEEQWHLQVGWVPVVAKLKAQYSQTIKNRIK